MTKEIFKEEQGIWIVYDLEANREIQKLLIQKKFAFVFCPSAEVFWKSHWKKNLSKKLKKYYRKRRAKKE